MQKKEEIKSENKRESHEVNDTQLILQQQEIIEENKNNDTNSKVSSENNNRTQLTYQQKVKVGVSGEKGFVMKYLEYSVKLQSDPSPCVYRRYNDFVWLYEYLIRKYPDEPLPDMPQKRGVIGKRFEPEFISTRRKGLEEFVTKLVNHPTFMNDSALKVFVSVIDRDFFEISKNALKNRLT